ncbi:hypothetical protein DVH24_010493 [Malus domestica]|uniref:Uncharacterized protein n=1 Tax=Malus domestica TaxID=3750 RepID=A0A498JQW8_MALDO|nr:hypothetical protein DVH24_010493 [Malus domestica]
MLDLKLLSLVIPTHLFLAAGLTGLFDLDLSSNSLSGAIPSELRMLTRLQYFNASHNNLSGEIPSALDHMFTLSSYDFSYNKLTGPLPTSGIFNNAPKSAFVGNHGLQSHAEGPTESKSSSTNSKSAKKNMVSVFLFSFLGFATVAIAIAFFLMFHKRSKIRPQPPANEMAKAVVLVMSIALACIRTRPGLRPTMHFVSQKLSAQSLPCLPEPFGMLTIKRLSAL